MSWSKVIVNSSSAAVNDGSNIKKKKKQRTVLETTSPSSEPMLAVSLGTKDGGCFIYSLAGEDEGKRFFLIRFYGPTFLLITTSYV